MLPVPGSLESYLYLLFITFLPYIELRGSIPVGIALGLDPVPVFLVCTVANVLIIPPIFVFLDFAYERLFRIGWIHRHFYDRVESVRASARKRTSRYGLVGLASFVAIPLPGTGAYTGCLAAFLLDLNRTKASIAIALGVLLAGILVTLASLGVFTALKALESLWASILVIVAILAAVGFLTILVRRRYRNP